MPQALTIARRRYWKPPIRLSEVLCNPVCFEDPASSVNITIRREIRSKGLKLNTSGKAGSGKERAMEKETPIDMGRWITGVIADLAAFSAENTIETDDPEKAFDAPLVGFSSGADPLYDEFVSHIGAFYLTPIALFKQAFPDLPAVRADELTVISWILPSTSRVRQEQAGANRHPSERWTRVRHYGEMFNMSLRRHVVEMLAERGVTAIAPLLAPFWARSDSGPYAPCSNWSERHCAYAAGLGTFGLCDGLITPVGKAMRTGSVVARVQIPASNRPYTDPHGYCLFFSHGTCGKCIPRCPVKAISKSGHDKITCMQYTEKKMNTYVTDAYGINTYACGLCQAGVPCTDHIPAPEEG
jgi:epoxyqueuosine reductase